MFLLHIYIDIICVCLLLFISPLPDLIEDSNELTNWFEPCSDEVCSIQHYVIRFVSDFQQVGGYLGVLRFPQPIELTATI